MHVTPTQLVQPEVFSETFSYGAAGARRAHLERAGGAMFVCLLLVALAAAPGRSLSAGPTLSAWSCSTPTIDSGLRKSSARASRN